MPVSAYCFDEPVCSICEFRLRDASSIKINRLSTSLLCGFWGDFASAYFSRSVEKSFPVFLERHASVCQKQWRVAADSRLDHFLSVDATDICGTICWLFFFAMNPLVVYEMVKNSRHNHFHHRSICQFSDLTNRSIILSIKCQTRTVWTFSNLKLTFSESSFVRPGSPKIREILYLQWSQTE